MTDKNTVKRIVSYAQSFEDVMLWRVFHRIENGRYIDIGAQDPVDDSVSKGFYELGWRGISVEPVPAFADRLRQDRPDETVIQAAVAAKPGEMTLFEVPESGLSTGDPDIAEQHAQAGYSVKEIIVPVITLDDILAELEWRDIHWLKIDVEGMEKEVLRGWKRAGVMPWVVVIESTYPNSTKDVSAEWEQLLIGRGYRFAFFDGLNRYYVAPGHEELSDKLDRPLNVHDKKLFILSDTLRRQKLEESLRAELSIQHSRNAELDSQLEELDAQLVELRETLQAERRESTIIQAGLNSELRRIKTALYELELVRPKSSHVNSLDDLLCLNGRDFVEASYLTMLGRLPDSEGGDSHLGMLRQGVHKLEILQSIANSKEAGQYECKLNGLDHALTRYRLASLPLFGKVLSAIFPFEDAREGLQRVERKLDELRVALYGETWEANSPDWDAPLSTVDVVSVDDATSPDRMDKKTAVS